MSTTIVPGAGSGVLWTQQGVGTTPGYSALDDRRAHLGPLQEGVLNSTDFMVVARAAGDNLSVDVTMTAGGMAYVQGDTISGQGLYGVPVHSATVNEAIAAADATNPRVDQVILEVLDNVHDASSSNLARIRVLSGTPTPGATLANRTGAASLPGSALLLADVLVPATDTTISNSQIRDRRKWARGAYTRIVRTTNAGGGSNYQTTSTSVSAIDAVNMAPRIECSGAPLRMTLRGTFANSGSTSYLYLTGYVDGAIPAEFGASAALGAVYNAAGQDVASVSLGMETVPTAGSHTIAPAWWVQLGGTVHTMYAGGGWAAVLTVEEIVRQNVANNSVTSG